MGGLIVGGVLQVVVPWSVLPQGWMGHLAGWPLIRALWLSFHGRAKLIQQYGAGNIAPLFRHIVMKHGIGDDPDWDTKHLGAGIIDAERVLRAPIRSRRMP